MTTTETLTCTRCGNPADPHEDHLVFGEPHCPTCCYQCQRAEWIERRPMALMPDFGPVPPGETVDSIELVCDVVKVLRAAVRDTLQQGDRYDATWDGQLEAVLDQVLAWCEVADGQDPDPALDLEPF